MNRLFIRYKNVGQSFIRLVTTHALDGQSDGRTGRRLPRLHAMQRGKINIFWRSIDYIFAHVFVMFYCTFSETAVSELPGEMTLLGSVTQKREQQFGDQMSFSSVVIQVFHISLIMTLQRIDLSR